MKKTNFIYIAMGSIFWMLAVMTLLLYGLKSNVIILLISGVLMIIAPVLVGIGASSILSSARANIHRLATETNNLQKRSGTNASAVQAVKEKLANQSRIARQDFGTLKSSLDKIRQQDIPRMLSQRATGDLSDSDNANYQTLRAVVRMSSVSGMPLNELIDESQAAAFVKQAIKSKQPIEVVPVLRQFPDSTNALGLTECRDLFKALRKLGYMGETATVMKSLSEISGQERDKNNLDVVGSELELYKGEFDLEVYLPNRDREMDSTTVLHFVGKALPETQTGYTLRTQYTAKSQQQFGVNPVIVAQSGSSQRPHQNTETYFHEGVQYYLLGGPQRNTSNWIEWLESNIRELAEIVGIVRPNIIHAHSDFLNVIIAEKVAKEYGIPLVNETRGFWEESWLSRVSNAENWKDLKLVEKLYGLPSAYTYRKNREIEYRGKADGIITLAQVMKEHIVELAAQNENPQPPIVLAPNAVDSSEFPLVQRNEQKLRELGIKSEQIVIGYISSIVEYEGIDTLINGFAQVLAAYEVIRESCSENNQLEDGFLIRQNRSVEEEIEAIDEGSNPSGTAGEEFSSSQYMHESSNEQSKTHGWAHRTMISARVDASAIHGDAIKDLDCWSEYSLKLQNRLLRLGPNFDPETVPEIAAALIDAVEEVNFSAAPVLLIVGDGAELENLKKQVDALGITESVIFTGRVPHEDVIDYYSIIDLFVVPRKPSTVTELVTPLKPFEAMSTGRPCIFSDVGALKEIADESGAAVLFEAGNPTSLAYQMTKLLSEPEEMARLAETGANWVREARTWERNAANYVKLYRELGMNIDLPETEAARESLLEKGYFPNRILEKLQQADVPKYEGWFVLNPKTYSADRMIADGWPFSKYPPVEFNANTDWETPGKMNRSWGFHLHAWEFIDPVFQEFNATGDENLLKWMLDVAGNWWKFAKTDPSEDAMVWYDMALSLRMPRLARLLHAAANSSRPESALSLLEPALVHIDKCKEPEAFNSGNNHGFFAAAASLDFSKWLPMLPGNDELHAIGVRRMNEMIASQFGPDGGHLEHSPDYHRMLLSSFEGALRDGLIDDADTRERVEKASHVMGWMVQPDGHIAQLGDSASYNVRDGGLQAVDPYTQFILSDGEAGTPNTNELLSLPDSGYAFVRSPQPQLPGDRINSSYLAFSAMFHSRAHKHADDLNFVWFDKGHEILVDAGRYGYIDLLPSDSPERLKGFYYSAPERQYVESTRAHNTVSVDGIDLQRRNRKPFGSALRDCKQVDGIFYLSGSVEHETHIHQRRIEFHPAKLLRVTDILTPKSDCSTATAWFNIDGGIDLEYHGQTILAVLPNSAEKLSISSTAAKLILPVRGQEDPLLGWRSRVDREFEPTWNFGYEVELDSEVEIVTSFVFGPLELEK